MNIFYNLNKNILLFLSRHTIFIILVIASFSNLNAQVETDINESSENRPYSRKLEVDSIRKSRVKYLRFSLTVKKGRIGLEKVKIQFYKKGEATAMINTMAKGKSTFKLNVNSEYIIKISYPGHSSRTISLNTSVPVENLLDLWPSYSFTAKLMDGITSEGQLTKPYVRIKYSPEIYDFEPGIFNWNEIDDIDEVKDLLTDVVKEHREELKQKEEEDKQVAKADQLAEEIIEQAKMKMALKEEQNKLDQQQQIRDSGMKEELKKDLITQNNNLKENNEEIEKSSNRLNAFKKSINDTRSNIRKKEGLITTLSGSEKIEQEIELMELKGQFNKKEKILKQKEISILQAKKRTLKVSQDIQKTKNQLYGRNDPIPSSDLEYDTKISALNNDIKQINNKIESDKAKTQLVKEKLAIKQKEIKDRDQGEKNLINQEIEKKKTEINTITNELANIEIEEKGKKSKLSKYKLKSSELENEYKKRTGADQAKYRMLYNEMEINRLGAERDLNSSFLFKLNKEQELKLAENEKLQMYQRLNPDDESVKESIEQNNKELKKYRTQINDVENKLTTLEKTLDNNILSLEKEQSEVNRVKQKESLEKQRLVDKKIKEDEENAAKLKKQAEELKLKQEVKKSEFKSELADLSIEQNQLQNDIRRLNEEKKNIRLKKEPLSKKITQIKKVMNISTGISQLQSKSALTRNEINKLNLDLEILSKDEKINEIVQKLSSLNIQQKELAIKFSDEANSDYNQQEINKLRSKLVTQKNKQKSIANNTKNIRSQIKIKNESLAQIKNEIINGIKEEKSRISEMKQEDAQKAEEKLMAQKKSEEDARLNYLNQEKNRIINNIKELGNDLSIIKNKGNSIKQSQINFSEKHKKLIEEMNSLNGLELQGKTLDDLFIQYKISIDKYKLQGNKISELEKEIKLLKNNSELLLIEGEIETKQKESKIKESKILLSKIDQLGEKLNSAKRYKEILKGKMIEAKSLHQSAEIKLDAAIKKAKADAIAKEKAAKLKKEEANRKKETARKLAFLAKEQELKREKLQYENSIIELNKKLQLKNQKKNELRSKSKALSNKISYSKGELNNIGGLKKLYKELNIQQLELKKLNNDKLLEKINGSVITTKIDKNKLNQKLNYINAQLNKPGGEIDKEALNSQKITGLGELRSKLLNTKNKYNKYKEGILIKEQDILAKQNEIKGVALKLKQEKELKNRDRALEVQSSLGEIINDENAFKRAIESSKGKQKTLKEKHNKLKELHSQQAVQKSKLTGGQLVIKEYELAKNELIQIKNTISSKNSKINELLNTIKLSEKRLERISIENTLKKLKPNTLISRQIANFNKEQAQQKIERLENEIKTLEIEKNQKYERVTILSLKAKKATNDAKLQAKLKMDKIKKALEEKEKQQLAAKQEAERIKQANLQKQAQKNKVQMAAAERPLDLQENEYQEGGFKIKKTIVVSRQFDNIYIKKTDKKGRIIYRKNDNPITRNTYELELRRVRRQFDEYNE